VEVSALFFLLLFFLVMMIKRKGLLIMIFGGGRMFIGSEEWNTERPWLDCRRKGDGKGKVAEEAGCACFECWPKEVGSDTRVSGLSIFDCTEDSGRRREG
jgi:hypothetical protein